MFACECVYVFIWISKCYVLCVSVNVSLHLCVLVSVHTFVCRYICLFVGIFMRLCARESIGVSNNWIVNIEVSSIAHTISTIPFLVSVLLIFLKISIGTLVKVLPISFWYQKSLLSINAFFLYHFWFWCFVVSHFNW